MSPATPFDRSVLLDVMLLLALLLTAVSLSGGLAHVFALPNKIGMTRDAYFTAQSVYAGWSRFAFVLGAQFLALLAVIFLSRTDRIVFWSAVIALVALVGAQALFWICTQPANVATANWTHAPDDWARLRLVWEYSHAGGALLQFIAMAALAAGAVFRAR